MVIAIEIIECPSGEYSAAEGVYRNAVSKTQFKNYCGNISSSSVEEAIHSMSVPL